MMISLKPNFSASAIRCSMIGHIEVTGKDDEYGIDNLADDNATAEVAPRQTMAVN